jgi:ectoine hydroxylase-related dioxygenase (phytanoyl-CoA dioxygenase family)
MRRLLRDEASHERLEDRGWTPLPPLASSVVDEVRRLAVELQSSLVRHAKSSDVGFDELWGSSDDGLRRSAQAQIAAALTTFLDATFEDFRPILYNLFVKRRRSDRSSVRYHQDFALIDERGGDCALQLWIPLVDTTPENGAMVVVERSHLDADWMRPHDSRHPLRDASLFDLPPGAVSLPRRTGHGIAFTNRTAHGSPPNRSADDRYAIGCILVPRDVPLVHIARRPNGATEIWSLSDEDMQSLQPGRFPASARLVERLPPPG